MSLDPAAPIETGRYCLVCCLEKGGEDTCENCGAAVDGDPPRQPRNLPPGALLDRRYLVGRSLGSGTFGITYLAVDIWLRLRVAVKEYMPRDMAMRSTEDDVVPNTDADRDTFRYGLQSFLDEVRKLARFEGHPNIVGVKSFFEENGTAYLVMQYLDGCSLEQYRRARGGSLPAGEVVAVGTAILEGLQTIHDVGMLHRDIKPQNVIITTSGKVKLIDFGAARFATGQRTSNLSEVLTPRYAPIEQYQSDEIQGPWTDVYATGATLYKVLTGELPPEAIARVLEGAPLPSPREILGEDVSEKVSDALMKALATAAVERYQSALEFVDGLSDPEQTPLVWPAPPSSDRREGEASCPVEGAGEVAASDVRSVAPASSGQRQGPGSGPSRPGTGSGPSRPGTGSGPSRPDPGSGPSGPSRGSRPSGPARQGTEATRALPGRRRRRKRRKTRGLWWLNGILALLVLAMLVVLVLLLIERGERGATFAGCEQLSPTRCAAEAVRLDSEGQSERALLLAYLAPAEEPDTRDRIFENAGVGKDWGSRERFACAAEPTPCSSLDFWTADRDAPGGDRALSALTSRCDQGDRDACYLRILVQRRLTLIEPEALPQDGPLSGVGADADRRGTVGEGPGDPEDAVESTRTQHLDSVSVGRDPAPVRVGQGASEGSRVGSRESSRATTDEEAASAVPAGGEGGDHARAPEGTGDSEVAPPDPKTEASADPSPVEPPERVTRERSERVVGEPVERVVDEPRERVVEEGSERVVDERSEEAPDPASGEATEEDE